MTLSPDWIDEPLDLLLGWTPGMVATGPRPWHPEDATPKRKTEAVHWMWIHQNRIAQTWRSRMNRIERCELSETSLNNGRRIVRALLEKGLLYMDDVQDADRANAEEALAYCVAVVRDGVEGTKYRLAAAQTVLSFTRVKPATKSEHVIMSAESFLDAVE